MSMKGFTDSETYGQGYKEHLLKQYIMYVEMADKVSQRRMEANSFFLAVNTLLITYLTNWNSKEYDSTLPCLVAGLAGISICCAWLYILGSYKKLNTKKFEVIHMMEEELPFSAYVIEWEKLGEGRNHKLYWPLSRIEVILPIVFGMMHLLLLLYFICSFHPFGL